MAENLNPRIFIGYEYRDFWKKKKKKTMRRAKRKVAAIKKKNNEVALTPDAATASATIDAECNQDYQSFDSLEEEYMSDDENALHGPCNIRPCNADENPRLVSEYLICVVINVAIIQHNCHFALAGSALLADILQSSLLPPLMKI